MTLRSRVPQALLTVLTVIVLSAAQAGAAIIIDGAGAVTSWGITPFAQSNQANVQQGGLAFTISNNYSPINYPGVGHVPSPGGSTGELFDLEELYVRVVNDQLQVLLVTSSPYSATVSGSTLYLGDLFLMVGDQRYGVVTQSASQGLNAGDVYRIGADSDLVALQQASGSYLGRTDLRPNDYGPNAAVADVAGPWAVSSAVDSAALLGQAGIDSAVFNYGGAENGTFLIEYSLDLDLFGLDALTSANAHITWGCGNDVIETSYLATPVVPEPATIGLVALGGLALLARRHRRTS